MTPPNSYRRARHLGPFLFLLAGIVTSALSVYLGVAPQLAAAPDAVAAGTHQVEQTAIAPFHMDRVTLRNDAAEPVSLSVHVRPYGACRGLEVAIRDRATERIVRTAPLTHARRLGVVRLAPGRTAGYWAEIRSSDRVSISPQGSTCPVGYAWSLSPPA